MAAQVLCVVADVLVNASAWRALGSPDQLLAERASGRCTALAACEARERAQWSSSRYPLRKKTQHLLGLLFGMSDRTIIDPPGLQNTARTPAGSQLLPQRDSSLL